MDGVIERVLSQFDGWLELIITSLPNLIAAVIVLICSWLLAKVAFSWAERLFARMRVGHNVQGLLARVIQLAILGLGFEIALSVMHLDKAAMSFLAGAGIVGLALGFAFQDLAANFISGVALSLRRPFRVGDVIETNDITGIAKRIDLRNSTIETFDGRLVLMPNKAVFEEALINHSSTGMRRIDLECGISYGDDLEKVKRVVLEALEAVPSRDKSKPVQMFFKGFGDSSINFDAFVWIRFGSQLDYLRARSEVVMGLKAAFDKSDITIPFPIRTLDFGIKGGERLADVVDMRTGASGLGSS